jgi:hypothetical protein
LTTNNKTERCRLDNTHLEEVVCIAGSLSGAGGHVTKCKPSSCLDWLCTVWNERMTLANCISKTFLGLMGGLFGTSCWRLATIMRSCGHRVTASSCVRPPLLFSVIALLCHSVALLLTGFWLHRLLRFLLGRFRGLLSAFFWYHVSPFWLCDCIGPSSFGPPLAWGCTSAFSITSLWVAIA